MEYYPKEYFVHCKSRCFPSRALLRTSSLFISVLGLFCLFVFE